MKSATCALALSALAAPALAAEVSMTRVLACQNDEAKMEIYIPQSAVTGMGIENVNLTKTLPGYYTLDLTDAEKGKSLDPVRVSLSKDKKTILVDLILVKLPQIRIPAAGGTVDFDKRFGEGAKCPAFNSSQ